MPTYRYINKDHTLVLRDDHVIAWLPHRGPTDDPQNVGERELWQQAGSPPPMEFVAAVPHVDLPQPVLPIVTLGAPTEEPFGASMPFAEDKDVADLRERVEKLEHEVADIVADRRRSG